MSLNNLLNGLNTFGAKFEIKETSNAKTLGFTKIEVKEAVNPQTGESYGLNFCCFLPSGGYKSIKASRDSKASIGLTLKPEDVEVMLLSDGQNEILRAQEL